MISREAKCYLFFVCAQHEHVHTLLKAQEKC